MVKIEYVRALLIKGFLKHASAVLHSRLHFETVDFVTNGIRCDCFLHFARVISKEEHRCCSSVKCLVVQTLCFPLGRLFG